MAEHQLSPAVALRLDQERVTLTSSSCGRCPACRRHSHDHCTSPGTPAPTTGWAGPGGRGVGGESSSDPTGDLAAWSALLAAIDVLQQGGNVLPRVGLIGTGAPLTLVREVLTDMGVHVEAEETAPDLAPDAPEVRALGSRLRSPAPGVAGPPDLILATDGNLALAARLVRRGGTIAAVGAEPGPVPMASIVQRELTILTPRDRAGAALLPHLDRVRGWQRQEMTA